MQRTFIRVVGLIGVSSKIKTKFVSAGFLLLLSSLVICLSSLQNISVASDITPGNVVDQTNKSRVSAGKSMLSVNEKLARAAEQKAEDMIENNYFSHTSPAGVTPWKWFEKESYEYNYAGENLAMDFHSTEKMEDAWMASPTHRANILNEKYSEIGASVKVGEINGRETILTVVMFGSGDKSLSSVVNDKKENVVQKEHPSPIKNIPTLPLAVAKKEAVFSQVPTITSPQSGEVISVNEIKIAGHARPGESLDIYDNENFVDSVYTDANGWFSTTEKNLSEGSHRLTVQNKKLFSGSLSEFFVDKSAPNINFHLYVMKGNSQKYVLEATASKRGCVFQFDGETREVGSGKKALFVIDDSSKSSAILKVFDQAGNKSFRQISLANYYYPEDTHNFSEKIAAFLAPQENIFAADSGREAMRNNLNLSAVIASGSSNQ